MPFFNFRNIKFLTQFHVYEQCACSNNGDLRKYRNRFKKSTIFYFIKQGITGNILDEDVDLVVIPEKGEHVDCKNPLKCAYKNLDL